MDIKVKRTFFDKSEKRFVFADESVTVSESRGEELIKKGFAESISIKAKEVFPDGNSAHK